MDETEFVDGEIVMYAILNSRMANLSRASWIVLSSLIVGGCMMEPEDDRLAQATQRHEAETKSLRQQLDEREQEISRQAAEELELRRNLSQANEQLAILRDQNRQLQSKLDAIQQSAMTSQKRLDSFDADLRKQLENAREEHSRALAERESQISRLKDRIRQLEELIARSGLPRPSTGTSPGR